MRLLNVLIVLFICLAFACADTNNETQNENNTINENDYSAIVSKGTEAIERGDFDTAYKLALPYAKAGDPDAQFTVGLLLGWGYGHGIDNPTEQQREEKAFHWYKKAAKSGHVEAMQALSDAYLNGWYGQAQDLELANCWKKAIDQKIKPISCTQ